LSSRSTARARYSFANLDEVLELPDLIAIQRSSFEWFLNHGLAETFADISPIKDFTETLQLELEFDPDDEDLRPPPKFSVDECKEKDMTYSAPIFVRARFMNAHTGEIKEQTVFMGDFPMMTDKGTFVINGTERVVVSQLVRSPGVIFQPGERFRLRNLTKHQLVTGTIHPYRGEWIEFDVEQKPGKDVTAGTRVARKRRLSLFVLLRALGYDEENHPGFLDNFVRHFDFLEGQWEKDRELAPTQDEALVEIYKRARPGEPPSVESARAYFKNAFFESRRYDLSRVGRYKLNRKLGPELDKIEQLFGITLERPEPDQSVLTPAEILATTTYLLNLVNAEPGYRLDDQDHFANRRIRSVGELIQNQVRIGLSRMERVVRERMTTQDVEAITPQTLINIRPVVAAIKEFFGTSQLSQFMDQVNPLSGLTHRRRLSALGPGGLSRERAGFEVRDVHFSHYGRMCPIETPEGPNIGLIGALSSYARVNAFGFIESPYRKVIDGKVTDEVVYLAADEEEEYVVAQANAPLNPDGTFKNDRVLVRRSPQAATLGELKLQLERDVFFGATTEISSVPPDRGPAHGRLAQADRLGRRRAHPVPRARRRQPGPHGRQHAAPGGAADQGRGPLHRHRHRGHRRPRRGRHDPRRGRRHRGRGRRQVHHRRVRQPQEDPPPAQVRAVEPGHLHQPEAPRGHRRQGQARAICSPTVPPPSTASWPSARTSSWPSCRGRATTSRTPSSSPSVW
jgi:DNA-directed RNA polymerase subunit beta